MELNGVELPDLPDLTDLPRLLKPREVGDLLRVDESTVLRWIGQGDVKASRLPGGTYRVPRAEVERILATPAAPAA